MGIEILEIVNITIRDSKHLKQHAKYFFVQKKILLYKTKNE